VGEPQAEDAHEHDDVVEQGGHGREGWVTDSGVRVFLDEITRLIAARLGQGDAPEREMMTRLDGVPLSVVYEAADRLNVVIRNGIWRTKRRA
jgi:hypothetical protein